MNASAKQGGNAVIEKITFDIIDYHASPVEAAQSAQTSKVQHLAFYHIVPPLIVPGQDKVYLDGVDDAFDGTVTIAQDGTIFSLQANSNEVLVVKNGW